MPQSLKNGNSGLNLKAFVTDDATLRKIISNYLKRNNRENAGSARKDIIPQAIFWLKKRMGFP